VDDVPPPDPGRRVNGRDDPSTVGASAIPDAIARLARERDLEIALLVRAGSTNPCSGTG
jgi:hypothetical protein